jgi:ADP-ribose pyrophosphatase YjhB (NUDIX family)
MEFNGKALYFVAAKVFLRDGDKILLTHDIWNNWEVPGGRIKPDEFGKDLRDVAARKLREELGGGVKYSKLKPTGTFFQVQRVEKTGDLAEQTVRIFAIAFDAKFDGGEIILGDNHDKSQWFDIKNFEPRKLQDNDWMRGVEDYLKKLKEEK